MMIDRVNAVVNIKCSDEWSAVINAKVIALMYARENSMMNAGVNAMMTTRLNTMIEVVK